MASTGTTARSAPRWYAAMRGRLQVVAPTPCHRRLWQVALVVTGVLAVWFSLGLGGPLVTKSVSNIALIVAAFSSAAACGWVGFTRHTGRERSAFILFGAGTLSWGLGQAVCVYYESVLGEDVPLPSLADVGYLSMIPLLAAGLLTVPTGAQNMANRARTVLDGLMVAAALLLVSWSLLVQPMLAANHEARSTLAISLSYPLGDLVVVTIVFYMVARMRQVGAVPLPLTMIGSGIVTFAVADSGYAYLTMTGQYSSGAVTDLGWFVGFTLIALAALCPAEIRTSAHRKPTDGRPIALMMPYAVVIISVFGTMFEMLRTGHIDPFSSVTRSVMILMIVGRQVLSLLENRALTRGLEARVTARTAQLRASERRFHALVQHSSDVVTVVDAELTVLYQSESMTRVFGHQASAMTGQPLTMLLDAEATQRLQLAAQQLSGRPYANTMIEVPVPHFDGRTRQAEMTVTNLLDDPSVHGLVLNTRDISERKELEDQLIHEAFHDALTKLANRALFKDRVTQALVRRPKGSTVAVLFLDLDGFKEVNDSLGHAAGDELLIKVAERLGAAVRPEDTVARFGGDEFAVLIESIPDQEAAEEFAQRVIDGMDAPVLIEGREIHIRGSIGIAVAGPDASDTDQIMRNADLAMYHAKAAGAGGYASYDPQMHSGLIERLQLEADLRRALEGDEFELHYQPTVRLDSGAVVGFEALLRWRHPTRGLVSPAEFITLAEATGMILPIGKWALTEACRQAAEWLEVSPTRPMTMAVNVSGRQFGQSDFADLVEKVLADTGLAPDRLCLEMTESVVMNDTEENLALLMRLKEIGVKLAIDDFGTGYSSLSYLRRFPVDTLKIDRSFVERLGQQSDDATLARTIVQLGQSLGMSTVAEGIEHSEQFLALRRMGCERAQGFYFSRPLPAIQAGAVIASGSPAALMAGNKPASMLAPAPVAAA
jgi:diguanylate cyclase (GGDEF)-like protein/PAS domain S-box-containing protein